MEEILGFVAPKAVQNGAQLSHSPDPLPPVLPEMESRFMAALNNKPGSSVGFSVDVRHFPLKEGFDSLVFHFMQVRLAFCDTIAGFRRDPKYATEYGSICPAEIYQSENPGTNAISESGEKPVDFAKNKGEFSFRPKNSVGKVHRGYRESMLEPVPPLN